MKKFLTVALALGLCVAVAMPAAAAVSVSGKVGYDIKYETRGEDDPLSVTANNNDAKHFQIEPNVEKAQIRFDWEAGPATPYIELAMRKYQTKFMQTSGADIDSDEVEIRFGAKMTSPSGVFGGAWEVMREWQDGRTNAVTFATTINEDTEYDASIWWQVNPMLKLSFGQFAITGGVKQAEKAGAMGSWDSNWVGRAEFALPIGKLTMDFVDPDDAGTVTSADGLGVWPAAAEENTVPGFAISLDAKVGPLWVGPTYRTQSFDWGRGTAGAGPAIGSDESFQAWAASIPVKAMLGPVSLMAAYSWGENINGVWSKDTIEKTNVSKVPGPPVFAGNPVVYTPAGAPAGTVRFDDSEYNGWNIEAAINAGIGKLMAGYGYDEMDRYLSATTRTEVERDVFFIKYAIPVGKGFTITPKYMKWNDAEIKDAGVVRPATDDMTRKLFAVSFDVRF